MIILIMLGSCGESHEEVSDARRVTTRTDLVGGPGALGELEDFVLENSRIKLIVQNQGYSRGFGVYGGGIIDADLIRPTAPGNSDGATGRDTFGELFPVYFLQALEPDDVQILDHDADGAARVQVSGFGGEFLSITKVLNRILLNSYDGTDGFDNLGSILGVLGSEEGINAILKDEPRLRFEVLYSLKPGVTHVDIETTMTNVSEEALTLPSDVANLLFTSPFFSGLARDPFEVPMGLVTLFGAGNQVFAPGFGFDIRFPLEDRYALAEAEDATGDSPLKLPALPGLITPALISVNPEGNSYGLFYMPEEEEVIDPDTGDTTMGYPKSFTYNMKDLREGETFGANVYELIFGDQVNPADSLIPFSASSFTGMFSAKAPQRLEPQDTFSMRHAFFVGDGDVSSIMDAYYKVTKVTTETVIIEVFDEVTGSPVESASMIIYDQRGRPINQTFSRRTGIARLQLPVGDYTMRVLRAPILGEPSPLSVKPGGVSVRVTAETPAQINCEVRGVDSRPLPAKVTVVGTVSAEHSGKPLRQHLFDLGAGQRWRVSDLVADDPNDPSTLRYIETSGVTQQGVVSLEVPAGTYEVYISRGTEYELKTFTVTLRPGEAQAFSEVLEHQVETPNYVSADFHLHAAPSLDSDLSLRHRVRTAAAEGLEHLVATDHNFVTDYQPSIEREGLNEWLSSMIGLELTTLEAGHFNTFPIERDKSKITRGAFEWSSRTPNALFEQARVMGGGETIIQVNHPRDLILGYFDQYGLDPLTGTIPDTDGGSSDLFSILGDLLAPNGAAFFDDEGVSQYSDQFDVIEVLNHGLFNEEYHARMPSDLKGATIYKESANPLSSDFTPLTPEEVSEIPVGEILCDGGTVAFPGVIDDWFNMLNLGKRYGGTANSDSHHGDDIGYPRTYVYVSDDEPSQVRAPEVAAAVRAKRMTMSRGPFLEFFINGEPIGSDLEAMGGVVELKIRAQAPRWVDVNRGRIYANGEVLREFEVTINPDTHDFEWSEMITLPRDTWLIAEVRGDRSMFPVAPPVDLPPVLLNEAFGTIAGPLGFGDTPLDEIAPANIGVFTPFALTNPIWVDVDGGGFTPPGVLPRRCGEGYTVEMDVQPSSLLRSDESPSESSEEPIRLWERHPSDVIPPLLPSPVRRIRNQHTLTRSFGFPRVRGELNDVRLIFEHFAAHGHQ
jgi:hypothetical protein